MPKIIEKPFDVGLDHEVILACKQLVRQRSNRVMRSPHRPVSVAARQKVRFVDGHEDLRHGALHQLILERRNA